MNRRSFLSLVGSGVAGLALDPERALWVPGRRSFFLPSGLPFAEDPVTGIRMTALSVWRGDMVVELADIEPIDPDQLFLGLTGPPFTFQINFKP